MQWSPLHPWAVSPAQGIAIQEELRGRIRLETTWVRLLRGWSGRAERACLVLQCCRGHRLPEPTRLADRLVGYLSRCNGGVLPLFQGGRG